MVRVGVVVSLALIASVRLLQAQTDGVSDPEALKLAAQSIAALTQGVPVADVKLSANVTSLGDRDYVTGPATLQAKGIGESRVDLTQDGSTRSQIRSSSSGLPLGAWTDKQGKANSAALHNGWTDAVWFFPALSSLTQTSSPNFVFSYLGQEERQNLSVLHLRVNQVTPKIYRILSVSVPQISTLIRCHCCR